MCYDSQNKKKIYIFIKLLLKDVFIARCSYSLRDILKEKIKEDYGMTHSTHDDK